MWTTPSLRIGTIALAAAITLLTPGSADSDKASAHLNSAHTFNFRAKADAALTEWALSRFEQAGLALPPLTIAFHDDKQPCEGNFGYYRSTTPARIDICGFNSDRFLVTPKKTILHELGHAWARHTLTDQARQAFCRLRGLAAWNDDDIAWEDQGSEQAAEIIAWALLDQDVTLAKISDADPPSLSRAYLQLTGTLPLLRIAEELDRYHIHLLAGDSATVDG
jgi:hypothetical protein